MTHRWFLASAVLCAGTVAATLAVWANRAAWLPDPVPIHWGWSGQPDGFVPRDGAFWWLMIGPLATVGLLLLGRLLPWLSPQQFAIEPFRETYEQIMLIVVLLLAYLSAVVLLAQTGAVKALDRWLVGGMLLMLALLGNLLGKVRKNFYVGVRTPWTLASDLVWERTHRLAAWLTVAGSAVGAVLLAAGLHPLLALAGPIAGLIIPVFYSLWLYKHLEAQGKLESQQQPVVPAP